MPFYELQNVPQFQKSSASDDIIGLIDTLYDYVEFVKGDRIGTLPEALWGTEVAVIGAGVAGLVAAYYKFVTVMNVYLVVERTAVKKVYLKSNWEIS